MLEVLKVLEAEINLREETRVAEQSRPALEKPAFATRAENLARTQSALRGRITKVAGRIRQLPDGETEFGQELRLLAKVEEVMGEAGEILSRPETGRPAIAAETEVIELLLQSRRMTGGGGGGGGANPGGGGGGTTNAPALSLVGKGENEKEVREDHGVSQATGEAGATLPEEFRAGLDVYFNKLQKIPAGK